jgi:hypothetical protein
MADPSLEVCPDFASEFYEAIRADLAAATNAGPQEIIDRLVETWTAGHDARVAEWNRRRDEEAQEEEELRLVRAAREEEEHLARQAEEENEHLESEKKKPKMNGFTAYAVISIHSNRTMIHKLIYITMCDYPLSSCDVSLGESFMEACGTCQLTNLGYLTSYCCIL